nr:nucleolar and coiled-body phosphoprotein 1-like [Aegilops tauschii subsp. strangulata]
MSNNSAWASIIAMMRVFDAHGLDQTWAKPDAAWVQEFFDSLSERPVREEKQLIRDTTDEEVAYIANRAEEAAHAEAAGSAGFRESEAGAEEDFAEQVESTGECNGATTRGPSAEEADEEAADDTDEEEPLEEPLVKGRRKRVLRRSSSSEPGRRASSPKEVPAKKATDKAAPRQGAQAWPVHHTRRTATMAEGAAAAASAAAKRRRSPSPPLRTDTIPEADYDLSGMSPNRRGDTKTLAQRMEKRAKTSMDLASVGQMDVDGTIEEIAKDAAAQADEVAADEAAKEAHEEATRGSAGEAIEGTGDRTDGIPASGAPGATPVPEPSVAGATVAGDQPSNSEAPHSSRYLKIGEDLFVTIPGTASTGAPAEGEVFDEEFIVAAGLQVVNEPSASSGSSKEDQLLQAISSSFHKLQALHRAHKEKLDSRMAVIEAAEAGLQECVDQTQVWLTEARQDLKASQEQLGQQWNKLLLKQSDIEKAQEEDAARIAKEDGELRECRISLDAQEEDLAAREEALAAKLYGKDEEIEKLVAQRTQELEQKHKYALAALVLNHAGKLKEAVDAAEVAETAKSELAGKVEELGAELEKHNKEVVALKSDMDKTINTLAGLQVTISDRNKLLSKANNSIDDLKLATLEETLASSRAREKTLTKKLEDGEQLFTSAAAEHKDFVSGVQIWTACLVDVSEKPTAQLSTMGLPGIRYSHDDRISESARETMFLKAILDALKLLHHRRATHLANESRKLCRGAIFKVLTKVAHTPRR